VSEIILTPAQLAERLQVPVSWVYKHVKSLPVMRCGMYLRFDWESVLESLKKGEHTRLQPIEMKRSKAHH